MTVKRSAEELRELAERWNARVESFRNKGQSAMLEDIVETIHILMAESERIAIAEMTGTDPPIPG